MAPISSMIPNPDDLLALEPEELAGVLLAFLNSSPASQQAVFNRYNLFLHTELVQGYPPNKHAQLKDALMEAWVWLEREGLLAPKPQYQGQDCVFITRRGQRLKSAEDLEAYRKANLLPKELLHPVIAQKVYAAFLRGEYDTSVFQAFREVEIAVRAAGGFAPTDVGVALMRKAFDSANGPLADQGSPQAERDALAHLFAGAIGRYKNPTSHRTVPLDAPETIELLFLASHLLKIVDSRSLTPAVSPSA